MWKCLLALAVVAACSTDDVETSTIIAELSAMELEDQGFQCDARSDPETGRAWTSCIKCETVIDGNGNASRVCRNYRCDEYGYNCRTTIAVASYDNDINVWREAEALTLTGMQWQSDPSASAGKSLLATSGGLASSSFEIVDDTMVYGWARVIAPSSAATSVWIIVDSSAVRIELPVTTTWTWVPLRDAGGAQAAWPVGAGTHALTIFGDEAGVRIDRVLLTANPQFTPVALTIQAESGARGGPMTVGATTKYPQTTYIWVPNGALGVGGIAQFAVGLPHHGNYAVWGRVNAPTSADNAFQLGRILMPRTTWATPVTAASAWTWTRADASLSPILLALSPSDVIDIAREEDGTKLDKFVVTNDPGFTMVEPPPPVVF